MNHLFEQPKAEAALQSLSEASQKHEKDIVLLKKLHAFSPTDNNDDDAGGMILRKLKSIEATLSSLESRVTSIERAIEIPGSSTGTADNVTIGQGVASNRKTLARALNLISSKADAEDVEKCRTSQNQAIAEFNDDLKKTVGSIENSNATIHSLSQRIDVLGAAIKTKVDDSAIQLIQTDASLISQHSKFQRTTTESIGAAKNNIIVHDESIAKHSEEISALTTRLSDLQSELDHRASRECLDSVLQKASVMSEKAQRDFDSLQTTFQDKDIIIARLEQDLQSVISSQHAASAQLSSQLREQREAVGHVVSRFASREALTATHAQVQRADQSLAELTTEHLVTKKQAALAAQFIAWYGNKQNEKVSVVG